MSAVADESLILTVFFLSGCTNPNRQHQRSRSEQQATSALFIFAEFSLLFVVISIGTQFRGYLQVQALQFTAFMYQESVIATFSESKHSHCSPTLLPPHPPTVLKHCPSTSPCKQTAIHAEQCLFVCLFWGCFFFCSSPVRVATEKHCGSCHQTSHFCDTATSLDKRVKTSKFL